MKIEICHFCETDYTYDNITFLLEGPAKEVNICEYCVSRANTMMNKRSKAELRYHRCHVCGQTKASWFYGDAPMVCLSCLKTMTSLIGLAKRIEYAQ